ncbi:DUF7507 domain-containing protein [Nakamurella leprariae]|uniref:DUF7507 domain-containing protein n=1 Tax=Nakamurella leprariae TaxID=2803911 RepID=A0A938YB97_9ACTN|nr:hypothetical protein [Nakamurella leprariae]MBM9469351.1 hypothetical protein [Nakamurella leprariae]
MPSTRTTEAGRRPRLRGRLVVAAVLAAGLVVVPVTPPAHAVSQPLSALWLNGLGTTMRVVNKVFNWETKLAGGAGVAIALSLAAPLVSSLFGDSGPSTQDVLDKLDDIEGDLDAMELQLDQVEQQVLQVDVDTLMGTCQIQTNRLTSMLAQIDRATTNYAEIVNEMRSLEPGDDPGVLKVSIADFLRTVVGDAKVATNAPLAAVIADIHQAMVTSGGGAGVIETCGKAFLQQWRSSTTTSGPAAGKAATDSAGWVDDRQYYDRLSDLVRFWQTAQAHALFLLEQAVLMQVGQVWMRQQQPLTVDDAESICRLAETRHVADAQSLCRTTSRFATTVHTNVLTEWSQVGVPYSDDQVVLSLGTDVTELRGPKNAVIPSTAWVRDPAASSIPWATTPQSWSARPTPGTVGDLTGWLPANSAQWTGLSSGYLASHPSVAPSKVGPRQRWAIGTSTSPDAFTSSHVPAFQPLDVLATMDRVTQPSAPVAGGAPAFNTRGVQQVWIPNETATKNLNYHFNGGGLSFPQGTFLPGNTNIWGKKFLPYYADNGFTVRCMVLAGDGVLCDPDTVGSWWVAQQETEYWVVSSNWFTDNDTGAAKFTVSPTSGAVEGLVGYGLNHGCTGGRYCGVSLNGLGSYPGITSVPSWIAPHTSVFGVVTTPPDRAHSVWPALTLPTGPGCTTVWGAPTRCGAALQAWFAATIPDPAVKGPVAATAPAVVATPTSTAADGISCRQPQWAASADPAGRALVVDPTTTWTVTTATGSGTVPGAATTTLSALAASGAGPGTTTFTLTCSVTASFAGAAATRTPSDSTTVQAALVDGRWVIETPDLTVDLVVDRTDPTVREAAASIVVINTGNVPITQLDVQHDVPGAVELTLDWPGRPGVLAAGERVTGSGSVDADAVADAAGAAGLVGGPGRSASVHLELASVSSTVHGRAPSGDPVTASDTETVLIRVPDASTTPTTAAGPTAATSLPSIPGDPADAAGPGPDETMPSAPQSTAGSPDTAAPVPALRDRTQS